MPIDPATRSANGWNASRGATRFSSNSASPTWAAPSSTFRNREKLLAILVDGKVLSAPVIRQEIPGGRARITGSFSREEAERIAVGLPGSRQQERSNLSLTDDPRKHFLNIERIARFAGNDESRFRVAAAYMTKNLPNDAFKTVRERLLPLLRDKDEVVRLEALVSFAHQKDLVTGPIILGLLRQDRLAEGAKFKAMQSLSALTGDTFGYDIHNLVPAKKGNREAIRKIEAWLKEAGADATLDEWVRTYLPGCTLRHDDEGEPTTVVSPGGETLNLVDAAKHVETKEDIGYWSTYATRFLSGQELTVRSTEDATEAAKLLHALSHGPQFARQKIYKPRCIPNGWVVEIGHDSERHPG